MKTIQDIQKLTQQYKTTFTHTNQITNQFNSLQFPSNVQSAYTNTINQLSPQLSDHNIIHKTRGPLRSQSQSIEKLIISKDQPFKNNKHNPQQSARQEKHFLASINGISRINSLKSQPNQTILTQNSSRFDPKVKRILSQMNKRNFLHFLLIQKVGHKDAQLFYDYLKRTYNFEIPYPILLEQSNKINKKDIKYLFTIDDDDETIKKTSQQIFQMQKSRYLKEVPLDKYVKDTYETQLRRFPKVRQKLEKSNACNLAL